MAQHEVIGAGFDSRPFIDPASGDATAYPSCRVSQNAGGNVLGLVDLNRPQATGRVVDIGLDRQSFIDRGWSNQLLGAWNDGANTERGGLFLSMYYALQMRNPNNLDHPWTEDADDWDRGLGAHIDFWCKARRQLAFNLYVYDHSIPPPPTSRGTIIGRRGNEPPFSGGGPCSGANVIGCAGGSQDIYLRTDFSWALGHRIDDPVWIQGVDGRWRLNITYVIAHETGHFFGFPHVENVGCIMNPSIGSDPAVRPRWQVPDNQMNPLFMNLADRFDP